MGFLSNLKRGLMDFFPRKTETRHIEITPESVQKYQIVKAQADEIAKLKGKLGRFVSEEAQKREREKDEEEEKEVKLELDKQRKYLQKKNQISFFSLKKLFDRIRNDKEFAKKIGIYTWNRSKKLSGFGDAGLSSDGDFIVLDNKNRAIIKNSNLKYIFPFIPSLNNDAEDAKIPICLNENREFVENIIDYWDVPDLSPTKSGDFKYTAAKKQPLYEYLNQLRDENTTSYRKTEELESTNIDLQKERDAEKRKARLGQSEVETIKKDLSQAEQDMKTMSANFKEMEKKVTTLETQKTILEDEREKLTNQLEKFRKEAERVGVELSFDDAMKKIDRIKDTIKTKTIIPPQETQKGEISLKETK